MRLRDNGIDPKRSFNDLEHFQLSKVLALLALSDTNPHSPLQTNSASWAVRYFSYQKVTATFILINHIKFPAPCAHR